MSLLLGAQQALTPPSSATQTVIETVLRYLLPPDRPGQAGSDEHHLQWSSRQAGEVPVARPDEYAERKAPAGTPTPRPEDSAPQQTLAEAAAAQNAFTLLDIDSGATRDPSSAVPAYPPLLFRQGIEGMAVVRFVVDTTGRADISTFRLIEANHPLFGDAVRAALPGMKFNPARMGAAKVRQMVEIPFGFQIVRRDAANSPRKPPP